MNTTNTSMTNDDGHIETKHETNDGHRNTNVKGTKGKSLLYGVKDKPPILLCFLLGFQHYMTMYGGSIAYPYILAPRLCMQDNDPARAYIMATVFFTSGLATLIQTTFGIRLPLVQGCAFSFLLPILSFLNLPDWQCPPVTSTSATNDDHLINSKIQNETFHLWISESNAIGQLQYPLKYQNHCPLEKPGFHLWIKNISQQGLWHTSPNCVTNNDTVDNEAFKAYLQTPGVFQCRPSKLIMTGGGASVVSPKVKAEDFENPEYVRGWTSRMNKIQGAIIVAGLTEAVIGLTGVMGKLLRWITPLTIVPTITQVGLSMFRTCAKEAGESWLFAGITIVIMTAFSQYLSEAYLPIPAGRTKSGTRKTSRFYAFKQFPVLLTIIATWIIALLATFINWIPEGHPARTDGSKSAVLYTSPWFRLVYPFQWGPPEFTSAAIIGMLCGVVVSIFESIGDYYACARLCEAPAPPKTAVNRAIFMEGIGCLMAGIFGSGGGVTSYSENIGAISITKVGSRRVVQMAAVLMMALSVFVKLCAVFATIPTPIMGGILTILSSIICAVGLSTLKFVDLSSSRNLFILGTSLLMGLIVPKHLIDHPDSIQTGSEHLDTILNVLLVNAMFVSGAIGFLLDNTMPGTVEERGLAQWLEIQKAGQVKSGDKTYRLPNFLHKFTKKLSFLPIFDSE